MDAERNQRDLESQVQEAQTRLHLAFGEGHRVADITGDIERASRLAKGRSGTRFADVTRRIRTLMESLTR